MYFTNKLPGVLWSGGGTDTLISLCRHGHVEGSCSVPAKVGRNQALVYTVLRYLLPWTC